uniref:Thioredoxin domain-containing protein n=1 Tax=Palpitomonas bilix TaxID=652834 RepID=A0A7S3GAU8_9EUKA|mmetsp:Transcript_34121/g.88059  ORF Transcript_34121/g.88059 Transcript_34121/m.88059 type:complete len:592 (+) Transcript_34121:249-2024(+)|eukprot:CAMPEP_0113897718 /NCGR_PEP_ID=MMETSP0780_2-20120614/18885_1 /TAXON_ID=652834 /ORGANISM="Palpitomonas bilix" /LENGTH=591 /DNA_ID=CAMNT_0000889313 /DNA_START=175 /DNA_END=1950 /DNA_ORIENTATION=- /assembly_acc=CAM_ASM_000599
MKNCFPAISTLLLLLLAAPFLAHGGKVNKQKPVGVTMLKSGQLQPLLKSETREATEHLFVLFSRTFCAQSERVRKELDAAAVTWNSGSSIVPPVRFLEVDMLKEDSIAKSMGVVTSPTIIFFRAHSARPVYLNTFTTARAMLHFLSRATKIPPVDVVMNEQDIVRHTSKDEITVVAIAGDEESSSSSSNAEHVEAMEEKKHWIEFLKFYRLAAAHLLPRMSFSVVHNFELAESLCKKGLLPRNLSDTSNDVCYPDRKPILFGLRQGRPPIVFDGGFGNSGALTEWLRDTKTLAPVVNKLHTSAVVAKALSRTVRGGSKPVVLLCLRDRGSGVAPPSWEDVEEVEEIVEMLRRAVVKVGVDTVFAGYVEGPVTTTLITTLGYGDGVGLWQRLSPHSLAEGLLLFGTPRTDTFHVSDDVPALAEESMVSFIQKGLEKKLEPLKRTAEIVVGMSRLPSFGPGVATITHRTFVKKVLLDEKRDTLLFVQAPYCGYCQRFLPYFLRLRDHIIEKEDEVRAHMKLAVLDVTTNDLPDCLDDHVEGYPEVMLIRRQKKGQLDASQCSIVKYKGTGNVQHLAAFLNDHIVRVPEKRIDL